MATGRTEDAGRSRRPAGARPAAPRAAGQSARPAGQRRPSPSARAGRAGASPSTRSTRPPRRASEQAARRGKPAPARKKAAPRRQGRAALRLLALVALLALALWLTKSRVFVLREVRVEGNRGHTASDIAAMAGLTMGQSIFEVNRRSVEGNLSAHSDVKLVDFSVTYPDTVFLSVSERQARAAVNCAGVILVVDEEGQILERLSSVPEGSVIVSGMDVSISAQGRRIESARSWQIQVMRDVLAEMDDQAMLGVISELNVADRYNLYLVSNTGVKIVLGDEENMPAKLVWARTVLEKLTEEGVKQGVLDVSTGKNAVYADR